MIFHWLGIARGTGWQDIGAYVNLGAYYLVGIPVALISGFILHFGGKGLWLGFLGGALVQCFMLSVIASCTDWRKQVFCFQHSCASVCCIEEI